MSLDDVFRETWPGLVASLARRFGDLDIAEEAAGEAVATAVERWPGDYGPGGQPPNPAGWLTSTATRKALDRLRREAKRDAKHQEALMIGSPPAPVGSIGPVEDDTLRLMFACAHPALAPEARIALTLRLVAGLTTGEIARAFLVPEATMSQRLTRAKRKVRDAGIPIRVPAREDLPGRLDGVLTVLYLVFNEGYLAGAGEDPIRADLTREAIRLTRLLRSLMPQEGEVAGLLALMLLTEARRGSRLGEDGELVMLDEQDRSGWDRELIAEGRALVRAADAPGSRPGRYLVQAAIGTVHADAPEFRATDWEQILRLYDLLAAVDPSPVVALNRAVAVGEIDGPAVALALVEELPLEGYQPWHATRAELLRRLGRPVAARAAYDAALAMTGNAAQRRYLERRRSSLARPWHSDPMPSDTEPLVLPDAASAESWINERTEARLSRARELAATLTTDPPTDALATLRIWDDVSLALHGTGGLAGLMANVHPVESVRTAAEAAEVGAQKLGTELAQDADLYAVFAGLATDGLDPLAERFHNKILLDFRRSGVDRDDATRARLKEINERLLELDQEFSRIARDDVRTVRVTPDRLGGLPADFVESHQPDEEGLVTITTDYPDSLPVFDYADDADLRLELRRAYLNRGYPAAEPVLREMLDLRHEYATTLGYADWASYDAEVKMIGSGEAIPAFIDKIADAAREPGERDLAILLERYRRDVPGAERVAIADAGYYRNLVFAERFDLDTQLVRTYFDFAKVRAGLLDITGRLFGVRYEQVDVPTWHEDVASYDVVRLADEKRLGRIHLDLHPRAGKYKHAAQFDLAPGVAGKSLAEGVLVCNFSRKLMEHDHVVTLFHEFGHLVHHVLGGQGEWTRFAGVATEWDFVEAPSQMLEEWAWDPAVLATFATNEAGEPIPAELVAKMREAEEFGKGYLTQTQTMYAAVSYYFHHERPADLTARMVELMERYGPFPYLEDTHFWASFGHLGGYSSGYYTYQWSLVIGKDLFSAFDPADLLDTEVAGRYRDAILAPGGSKDAADLVEDFLGRPFTFAAYADWLAS